MKILGLVLNTKIIAQILLSTFLGGLIGLGIELWRENEFAVFLCAFAGGIAAMGRLRRQQTGTQ